MRCELRIEWWPGALRNKLWIDDDTLAECYYTSIHLQSCHKILLRLYGSEMANELAWRTFDLVTEYCKQATVKVLLAVFGNISNEKALSIVTYSHWQIKTFITNHVLFLIQTTSEAFTPKAVSPGAPREVQMPRRYSWIALLKIYVLQEYWSSFYPIKRYRCKILQGISISDIPVLVDCFPLILIESILYGEQYNMSLF